MTSGRRPPEEERRPADLPSQSARSDASQVRSGEGRATSDDSAVEVEQDLDALLADIKRERDEYLEIAQRARADFENYRKRAAREAQEAERRAKAGLARELVPALDNLERALRSAGIDPETAIAGPSGDTPSEEVSPQEAFARGVALVYGELRAALERAGVETYDPTGERFDPTLHEALSTGAAGDGVDSGVVIETLEKGYRLDGQVLRAARVVVSA
jgi:molecular chaperone GrpE